MQCSSCSREVKPVVAFDIDGTLGDYHGQLIDFVAQYVGREPGLDDRPFDGSMNFGDWIIDAFDLDSRKTYRDIKLAFRQGGSKRTMPPYRGRISAVWAARNTGCEIWLTTTRPYMRLDSVDPDTREWLRRNNVPFDHLMYDEHKYPLLAQHVEPERVILIVDDLSEQYDEAAETFAPYAEDGIYPPVLIRTPYNAAHSREVVVDDDSILKSLIIERVKRWNNKYDRHDKRAASTSRRRAVGFGNT